MSKPATLNSKALLELGLDASLLEDMGTDLEALKQLIKDNPNMGPILADHIKHLESIVTAYRHSVDSPAEVIEGTVASAVELTPEQLASLTKIFSEKTNKIVALENKIDKTLIGGYRVRIGDAVYDNSIKLQIQQIKKQLLNVEL